MATGFRKFTRREVTAIMVLLEQHLIEVSPAANGRPAIVRYAAGWDDVRVANEAIPNFPGDKKANVAGIRSMEFGSLERAAPARSATDPSLGVRLNYQEALMNALMARLGVTADELLPAADAA